MAFFTIRSASDAAGSVERPKYVKFVVDKSLMDTKEEEEKKNVTKKELQSSPYDKRFGADSRGNDRADRKYAASNYGVIERAKKNAEMTTLVLAIYAERLLLVAVFNAVVMGVSFVRTAVGAM